MNTKFFILIIFIAIIAFFAGVQFFLDENDMSIQTQDKIQKTKLDIKSLFNIYGYENNFRIQDGKKIWNDAKFELNPDNNDIYLELNYSSIENAVVIYPIFTASAYSEPGFYTFFRGDCDQECLTDEIDSEYSLDFVASGNGYQVLNLLGYPTITDIDVDQNPAILEKYDKVILLHNEYVTKKEFDAITNHPKVLYLYPNALYAEIEVDYQKNTISLIRGHNFPEPEIVNGFDWEFDNSNLEYDMDCKDMGFDRIVNGWMLNCYPENPIHQSKVLLQMIKDF